MAVWTNGPALRRRARRFLYLDVFCWLFQSKAGEKVPEELNGDLGLEASHSERPIEAFWQKVGDRRLPPL